jgi:multiple antibiotic resistance protein
MLNAFVLTCVAMFVALDIVGTLPMYVGMTSRLERTERNRILDVSMLVAFVVAVAFAIAGLALFKALGITLADFRIAGGIVLLLISLADVVGGPGKAHTEASGSTGIVPLAVPLITGPAVLTTLVLQIKQVGYGITLLALFSNYVLAWAVLRKSDVITRVIGNDGTVVFSKISALLLAAIAIAMIRSGVFEAIQLAHFNP